MYGKKNKQEKICKFEMNNMSFKQAQMIIIVFAILFIYYLCFTDTRKLRIINIKRINRLRLV